jgi:hypothetical protein
MDEFSDFSLRGAKRIGGWWSENVYSFRKN